MMPRSAAIALAVACLAASTTAQVPGEFDPLALPTEGPKITTEASVSPNPARPGEVVTVELAVEIVPGWHLYGAGDSTGTPTTLSVDEREGIARQGTAEVPFGEPHESFGIESFWIEDEFVVRQKMRIAEGHAPGAVELEGQLVYMACTESFCDPEATERFSVELAIEEGAVRPEHAPSEGDENEANAAEAASEEATSERAGEEGTDDSLWAFILLAIGGGLFALAMPCTYPMIPITISFFTKQAADSGRSPLPLAVTYGLGIVAMFVLIAVTIGQAIAPFAVHPITNLVIAALFFVFALVLFGVINLQPPAFLMNAAAKSSGAGGYTGVFLMGATLVITSFTCTAPFVGNLLAVGATGGLGRLVLGMAVFGATMALPFVLLSLLPSKLQTMPRSGEWMNTLKVFLGFVELAAALKFLSNVDMVWGWGWLSRELFLSLWAGIFGIAALLLFGIIKLKEDVGSIGSGRLTGALATALLAIYCAYGAAGNRMDFIMTSIVPPYSNRIASAGTGGESGDQAAHSAAHTIVVDDYDKARQIAIDTNRKLLLNFTGVT